MFLEARVKRFGPIDAADFVDIAEALRGEERGACAGALDDSVDHDCRTMDEDAGLIQLDLRFVEGVHHAASELGRS